VLTASYWVAHLLLWPVVFRAGAHRLLATPVGRISGTRLGSADPSTICRVSTVQADVSAGEALVEDPQIHGAIDRMVAEEHELWE
jgi:hypothetical protein